MVAGELLTLTLAIFTLARRPAFHEVGNYGDAARVTLKAALPFNLNGLLITAYNRLDVVVLGALASAQQLGMYAPASRIQDALMLITSSLGVIAFPLVSAASARGRSDEVRGLVRRLVIIGLAISIPVAVVMTLLAPIAIRTILGADYVGAVTPTRILVWSLPFMAVSAPLLSALAGSGHAGETTKVFAAAFLTAIALHLSLDWWWGATGGAVASFVREPVALLVVVVIVIRLGLLNRVDYGANLKTGFASLEAGQ
jgi:O-antigen/teichoic acid export membrane protein